MDTYLCVVTGASSDIGCAWLKRLSDRSADGRCWNIVGQYRTNNPTFEALVAKDTDSFNLIPFRANLEKQCDRVKFIEYVRSFGTPTHILHLAARPLEYMRIKDFDCNKVQTEMEIQFFSIAEILSAFLGPMEKNKFGRIVSVVSSVTLGIPPAYMSDYTAIKYAVLGFMRSAANEYRGKGICINCISPAMVKTKFLSNLDSRIPEIAASSSPLGRNITKEEVAGAIDYLFSEDASCVNGVNLNLSGGEYI